MGTTKVNKRKTKPNFRVGIVSTTINPFTVFISEDIVIGDKTYNSDNEYKFIYEHIFEIMLYFEEALGNKYDITYYFNGKEMPFEDAEQSYNDWMYKEGELGI